MKNPSSLCHAAALGLVLCAATAQAHDAWIEPSSAGFTVVFGHDGKLETALASKVLKAQAVDAAGQALPVRLEGLKVALDGKPSQLLLHYDNGFWSRTPQGSRSGPKNEVPGALGASHALKYGKTLLAWDAQASRPQGLPVEIVPHAIQAPAAGSRLPVQVLWDGQPLAGAVLSWHEGTQEKDTQADAQGRASVPVVQGRQMVSASARRPLPNDPRADTLSVSSALVFEAR
jgi:nickel transport protein